MVSDFGENGCISTWNQFEKKVQKSKNIDQMYPHITATQPLFYPSPGSRHGQELWLQSSRIIERSSDFTDVPLLYEDNQRIPAHKVILFPASSLLQLQHGKNKLPIPDSICQWVYVSLVSRWWSLPQPHHQPWYGQSWIQLHPRLPGCPPLPPSTSPSTSSSSPASPPRAIWEREESPARRPSPGGSEVGCCTRADSITSYFSHFFSELLKNLSIS